MPNGSRGGSAAARESAWIERLFYCGPLGDWFAPPPDGADRPLFAPPERAPPGARPSVDEAAPALPWLERWLALAPVRAVPEPPRAVDVRLRTLVRVDTPFSTATPARRLWITTLEGSWYLV